MKTTFKLGWLMALCVMSTASFAQSPYYTIFGYGLLTPSNGAVGTLTAPSSAHDRVNSMYDEGTGALIFTVNTHGIYNAGGTQLEDFTSFGCAYAIISEIEILPIPSQCNNYQVMFWSRQEAGCTAPSEIRLNSYRVHLSGTSYTVDPLVIVDTKPGATDRADIVADKIDHNTGIRKIYTLYRDISNSVTTSELLGYEMSADGTISIAGTPVVATGLPHNETGLLELNIHDVTGSPTVIAYGNQGNLITVDLTLPVTFRSTGVVPAPDLSSVSTSQISGIEYVFDLNKYYVSYTANDGGNGGIALVDITTTPNWTPSWITGSWQYRLTDLEYSGNHVWFVGAGSTMGKRITGAGELANIDVASPTTIVPISGSSTTNSNHGNFSGPKYYIQNQIDVENYDDFYPTSSISASSFTIAGAPRVDQWNITGNGTGCYPQQVCAGNAGLDFNIVGGVTDNDMYRIKWVETDPCGVPKSPATFSGYTSPWLAGPVGVIDLEAFGNLELNPAVSGSGGHWFKVTAWINRACQPMATIGYDAIIVLKCPPKPGRELGVNATATSVTSVYPNPASGVLNVKADVGTDGTMTVKLLDMIGRTVQTISKSQLSSGQQTISVDVQAVPAGIYQVQVISGGIATMHKVSIAGK